MKKPLSREFLVCLLWLWMGNCSGVSTLQIWRLNIYLIHDCSIVLKWKDWKHCPVTEKYKISFINVRILIYITLFVLIVLLLWWLIRLFRNRRFLPALLNLFNLVTRFISPYILIRMILNLIKKLKGFWKNIYPETSANFSKSWNSFPHMYCNICIINGESFLFNLF